MRILLLEDLPEIRQWLKALVMQVFPASQVSESARVHDALQQITAMRFDLALIDLGRRSGRGLARVAT
jgi:DNA-binding response OmpR family regulator